MKNEETPKHLKRFFPLSVPSSENQAESALALAFVAAPFVIAGYEDKKACERAHALIANATSFIYDLDAKDVMSSPMMSIDLPGMRRQLGVVDLRAVKKYLYQALPPAEASDIWARALKRERAFDWNTRTAIKAAYETAKNVRSKKAAEGRARARAKREER